MRALPRDDIEIALNKKGFEMEDSRDHRFWFFLYKGQRTEIRTKTSRGSKYKDYPIGLLKRIKEQLRLDSLNQLKDLVECPIDKEDYEEILKKKGII